MGTLALPPLRRPDPPPRPRLRRSPQPPPRMPVIVPPSAARPADRAGHPDAPLVSPSRRASRPPVPVIRRLSGSSRRPQVPTRSAGVVTADRGRLPAVRPQNPARGSGARPGRNPSAPEAGRSRLVLRPPVPQLRPARSSRQSPAVTARRGPPAELPGVPDSDRGRVNLRPQVPQVRSARPSRQSPVVVVRRTPPAELPGAPVGRGVVPRAGRGVSAGVPGSARAAAAPAAPRLRRSPPGRLRVPVLRLPPTRSGPGVPVLPGRRQPVAVSRDGSSLGAFGSPATPMPTGTPERTTFDVYETYYHR
jgi:hypothetical protein